jgi:hypothetical protein
MNKILTKNWNFFVILLKFLVLSYLVFIFWCNYILTPDLINFLAVSFASSAEFGVSIEAFKK